MKLVRVHDHHPLDVRRHGLIEQPRVARHFHGHFIRRPQLLHELRQTIQRPLAEVIPSIGQPHAAGQPPAVQIDPDIASLSHLSSCAAFLARRSRPVLRRSPFSYPRSPCRALRWHPATGLTNLLHEVLASTKHPACDLSTPKAIVSLRSVPPPKLSIHTISFLSSKNQARTGARRGVTSTEPA